MMNAQLKGIKLYQNTMRILIHRNPTKKKTKLLCSCPVSTNKISVIRSISNRKMEKSAISSINFLSWNKLRPKDQIKTNFKKSSSLSLMLIIIYSHQKITNQFYLWMSKNSNLWSQNNFLLHKIQLFQLSKID